MHKTEKCLRTADFYCVHGTHRSEFSMRTERKIMRTYAVRIVIYFVAGVCRGKSIFLIIAPKHRLWVLRGGSSVYPQSMSKNKKNVNFSAEILFF